jgi:putative mRNA 3-end processing factor
MARTGHPSTWLYPTPEGLYCAAGKFHVDPQRPVERAVITHGHADHARPNHAAVLATPDTLEIMRARYGDQAGGSLDALPYGETRVIDGVPCAWCRPATSSAPPRWCSNGRASASSSRATTSAAPDPTCAPFELVPCDVFITEATFALPVFRHEPAEREIGRLLASLALHAERPHLLGVYALGKCQRMIVLLRAAGYDAPIYLHGALIALCELYERLGVGLGTLLPFAEADPKTLGRRARDVPALGARRPLVAPPRRSGDGLRQRLDARSRPGPPARRRAAARRLRPCRLARTPGDHRRNRRAEVWATHGRDDALTHQLALTGRKGRALSLVGYEDEDE